MQENLAIVLMLTIGLGLASFLACVARLLKLPSILGYLLAGYIIGPYSPGFVADHKLSEQLAELGVILMLFGVGLHFKLQDLISVKSIAIPGALVQTLLATIITTLMIYSFGGSLESGVIMGLSIGVASTVVLVRILTDNNLLSTIEGHIAVGWLVVEDIFTVIILILLPSLATFLNGYELSLGATVGTLALVLLKIGILWIFMFTLGHRIVNYILLKIAHFHSQELFTLTLLAILFIIALGSTYLFETSIALGAFIAGMVVGKTTLRHQAAANALSLKDIFAVVFFLSVGMLFNPMAILDNFPFFLAMVFVVLIIKPLSAYLITTILGYSIKIALTVAIALAQIGEFSFILAEQALQLKILPHEGFDTLVAVSLLTISLNPILFQLLHYLDPFLTHILRKSSDANHLIKTKQKDIFLAKRIPVVGFGAIGQSVAQIVKKHGYTPVIIEHNIDTVAELEKVSEFIFGEATDPTILTAAGIEKAKFLLITILESEMTLGIIDAAKRLNPKIKIVARVNHIAEEKEMAGHHVTLVCSEQEALQKFDEIVVSMLK